MNTMNKNHHNEIYPTLCLVAVAIAITGVYTHDIHFIRIAAMLTMACIIDSWRR